jgi:hypothetical protein
MLRVYISATCTITKLLIKGFLLIKNKDKKQEYFDSYEYTGPDFNKFDSYWVNNMIQRRVRCFHTLRNDNEGIAIEYISWFKNKK